MKSRSPIHSPIPYQVSFSYNLLTPRLWPSWLALGMIWMLAQFPRAWQRTMATLLAKLMWYFGKRPRHIATINLQLCFPELDPKARHLLLQKHLHCTAQCLLDYSLLWFYGTQHNKIPAIEIHGLEHYYALREAKRPVILLAAHTAALDLGGLELGRVLGDGFSMAKPMKNPLLEWINHRSRTRYGADIFSRSQGLRPLLQHIRAGRVFYYLPDEDLGLQHAVFADFFGTPKATLTTLGRLAKMTNAAVLPCISCYQHDQDRYKFFIYPAMQDFPVGDKLNDAKRMNATLEYMIRQYPEQYLWTFRFFKTRPDPTQRIYR